MPVSSYAPELLVFFQRAAQAPLTIELNDKRKAIHFRARLHNLRREMRKEGHNLTRMANGVQISVTAAGNIYAYPSDASYLDALKAAGVEAPSPTSTQAGTPAPNTPAAPPALPAAEDLEGMEQVLKGFFHKPL